MSHPKEQLPAAIAAVRATVRGAADAARTAPTPCSEFDLAALVDHFTGTTAAMGRVGRREPLDPEDPWGSRTDAYPDWRPRLTAALEQLGVAWSTGGAWDGTVDTGGQQLPAAMIGEMAFIEVLLHGWDLGRSCGRDLVVTEELATGLHRAVVGTAELGRRMGAYGPPVAVPERATAFERALGASGRDPAWRPHA